MPSSPTQGKDSPTDALNTRNNIAYWTGQAGKPSEALRLFQELLPDRVRVLGPEHPDTVRTRNFVAYWIGHAVDPEREGSPEGEGPA
ncbi:MAG: tetratricopeptide repeat protein [Acidimicrobiia bacterium]